MIPEEVLDNINAKAIQIIDSGFAGNKYDLYQDAAEFGYSLAFSEIESLTDKLKEEQFEHATVCLGLENSVKEIEALKGVLKDNGIVELTCMGCGETFYGDAPKMCCSGRDCGCMGLPIDPILCSKECYEKLPFKQTNNI